MIFKFQITLSTSICIILLNIITQASEHISVNKGLNIQNTNSHLAYISYNDEPLLAFGCHFEHMLFDDYDYKNWTEWMINHGMKSVIDFYKQTCYD